MFFCSLLGSKWSIPQNGSEIPFRTKSATYFIGGLVEQSLCFLVDNATVLHFALWAANILSWRYYIDQSTMPSINKEPSSINMSDSQRPAGAGLVRQNWRNRSITRIVMFILFLSSLLFNVATMHSSLSKSSSVLSDIETPYEQQVSLSYDMNHHNPAAGTTKHLSNQQLDPYLRVDDDGNGTKRIYPSWAVVTQCSLYHTDCPNHLDFQDYPFPLPPESQLQQDDDKSTGATDKWIEEFIKEFQQKSNTSDTHLIGYEFPAKVDDAKRQECIISNFISGRSTWQNPQQSYPSKRYTQHDCLLNDRRNLRQRHATWSLRNE